MEYRKYSKCDKGTGIMDPKSQELLEIYKLHAELADRVSKRREVANRLFVTLLLGTFVFLAGLLRFGDDQIPVTILSIVIGVLGILLSAAWYVVIRSYRQLNTGKFAALHELEDQLAYPFFKREWELLGKGTNIKRYWKLTVVETSLPIIFASIYLSIVVFMIGFSNCD